MLDNDKDLRAIGSATEEEQELMRAFLQGCVYCWCQTNGHKSFHLRDLMGGTNEDWTHTPLIPLYTHYTAMGRSNAVAFEQAAKDAGWLLKRVLERDHRRFRSFEEFGRAYEWVA